MIMQVFLSSDGLMVFGLFLLFCIIEDDLYDTMQCCAASLVLCQTTHLWINVTTLSGLSVSYQKFSINNGALQVRRRLPSVCQTYMAADRQLGSIADIVMKVVMLCFSRVFSRMYFWRSRGAASQPLSCMTGNLISRRMEVFRLSDSIKLGERKPLCGAQTQLTSILYPEHCITLQPIYRCPDMWSQ